MSTAGLAARPWLHMKFLDLYCSHRPEATENMSHMWSGAVRSNPRQKLDSLSLLTSLLYINCESELCLALWEGLRENTADPCITVTAHASSQGRGLQAGEPTEAGTVTLFSL